MSLLKQFTKTSLLSPYKQFYIQSLYTTRNSYQYKTQVKQPNVTAYLQHQHNVTTCDIHRSITPNSTNFLDLSIEHTLLLTWLLILMVRTIFYYNLITHSKTLYWISWKTFNVTSYGFIFLCFLSFYIVRFNYCLLYSYRYI